MFERRGAVLLAGWIVLHRLLFLLPPERAHDLALMALRHWPFAPPQSEPILTQEINGLVFPNPIGLAAGLDKNAIALKGLARLGFGFLETGTITPRPQRGNPRPRLFRLKTDQALINRMGFNNGGMELAADRLKKMAGRSFVLGVNIGRNKDSAEAIADYIAGAIMFQPLADYLTINISSPNTPGLRALQAKEHLQPLLEAVRPLLKGKPLWVKLAPDLKEEERKAIAALALDGLCDGLVLGNTTLERPSSLDPRFSREAGGLSGRPLFSLSTAILADFYRLTEGRIPLIGVGGIEDGETAYRKIRAGASLLQLYTALIYQGPLLVARILKELTARLRADGFAYLSQAIGADHR